MLTLTQYKEQVLEDINALQGVGVTISEKTKKDYKTMKDCFNGGLSVSDCTDLLETLHVPDNI
tara:strand:- start:548 stop:736 length:189 start_codon:yes stop_codon:yes gene_type:complete